MANLLKIFKKLLDAPTEASRRKFLKSIAAAPLATKLSAYQSFAATPPNDPILALHKDYLKHAWAKAHDIGRRIAGGDDYLEGIDEEPGLASFLEIPKDAGGYSDTPEELAELFGKHGLEPTKELVDSLDDLRKRSIVSAYMRHPTQNDFGGSWDYDDLQDTFKGLVKRGQGPNVPSPHDLLFDQLTNDHSYLSKADLAELLKVGEKKFPLLDDFSGYYDELTDLEDATDELDYTDELLNDLPIAPRGTRPTITPADFIPWNEGLNVEKHPLNPTRHLTTYLDEDYQ